MIKTYKKDNRYTIVTSKRTSWCEVRIDGKIHAKVIDIEEARRVIFLETGKGEYIIGKDFE